MSDPVSTAASALRAAGTRVGAVADNMANMRSDGRPGSAQQAAFVPRDTVQSTIAEGGVTAETRERENGTALRYDPKSPFADAEGLVESPTIAPENEIVERMKAEHAYSASLKILETHRRMGEQLKALL